MRPIHIIKFAFIVFLLFFFFDTVIRYRTVQIRTIEICMCQTNMKWTLLYFCIDFVLYYTTISYTNVSMFDNASMIDRLPSRPYSKMQRNKKKVVFSVRFSVSF